MPWLHLLSKFDILWMISFCSCISFSTDKCFWGKVEFVPFAIAEQSKSSQVACVLIVWRKAVSCLFTIGLFHKCCTTVTFAFSAFSQFIWGWGRPRKRIQIPVSLGEEKLDLISPCLFYQTALLFVGERRPLWNPQKTAGEVQDAHIDLGKRICPLHDSISYTYAKWRIKTSQLCRAFR